MKKAIIILIIFALPSILFSEEWNVKKSKSNLVKFTSTTPVLDFDGITDDIDGYIYWEGEEKYGENNEIYFEVNLNSVETGIGKRDRDMREDVLETDKWPKTSYKGKIINVVVDDSMPDHYKISSKGKMFIHGHTKEINIEANISIENNKMSVLCDFSVFLEDYEIEAPSLLAFIKVAEEIKLHLNFELEKALGDEN